MKLFADPKDDTFWVFVTVYVIVGLFGFFWFIASTPRPLELIWRAIGI